MHYKKFSSQCHYYQANDIRSVWKSATIYKLFALNATLNRFMSLKTYRIYRFNPVVSVCLCTSLSLKQLFNAFGTVISRHPHNQYAFLQTGHWIIRLFKRVQLKQWLALELPIRSFDRLVVHSNHIGGATSKNSFARKWWTVCQQYRYHLQLKCVSDKFQSIKLNTNARINV